MDIPIAEYGSWQSKITAETVATKSIKFGFSEIDGDTIYYEEIRPENDGKSSLVKQKIGKEPVDLLPKQYNVRTRIHEYGGKSFFVKEKEIYFVNFNDQRIYKIDGNIVTHLTEGENFRYADIVFDKEKNCLYSVQEEHKKEAVINSVIKIDLKTKAKTTIASGRDFYASLTLSLDNKKLAFISWNHPNMPWDGANLMVYQIDEKKLNKVAGGVDESIFQPSFGPDGRLYFVSDKNNFWNLYCLEKDELQPIYLSDAEMGVPLWQLGITTYSFIQKNDKLFIYAICSKNGRDLLSEIDISEKKVKEIKLPFTSLTNIKSSKDKLIFFAQSATLENSLILYDTVKKDLAIVKHSRKTDLKQEYISKPEAIEFLSNNKKIYAFYYPPKNPDFAAPKDSLPPLIVKSHGGPTGQSKGVLNLETQYWTSRGFALVDVNYCGSSGYGREYRQSLYGKWGVADVDDCCNAALYLVKMKKAHPKKLIVRGGSAGGYTTLACLAFTKVFNAGASYFGLSELITFIQHTHKFEARYLDKLIGPYPKEKDLYIKRSPLYSADKISCPVLLLQGEEDMVVPKEQAEMMFKALLKQKIPTAYLLFPHEQHGFRSSKNIKRALEAEHYFYSKIFGFEVMDKIEPINIENF